jgi:hypothetical protein
MQYKWSAAAGQVHFAAVYCHATSQESVSRGSPAIPPKMDQHQDEFWQGWGVELQVT